MTTFCALCELELPQHPIHEGIHSFCCSGCHTVFTILSTKNVSSHYRETSIFQEAVRSGLISNPALLEQIRLNHDETPDSELQKLHLEIGDMWCPACAELIRLILMQKKGVRHCVVDYATDLASIEYSPRYFSKESLCQMISSLGYRPTQFDANHSVSSKSLYIRFIVAAFCALNVMMFSYPLYVSYFYSGAQHYGMLFAWLSLIVSLPVLTYSAWPIIKRFYTGLSVGFYGMETLVIIGISTSFFLSLYALLHHSDRVYFDSLTVIITFVLLGKILENKAKFSAKSSLFHLARSIPKRGRKRMPDGTFSFVSIKEIHPGDTLLVCGGEKIPTDGVIIHGEGFCDESLMTGEAKPVSKFVGCKLLGGTVLQSGSLQFQVTQQVENSALHRILDMVQQEIGNKHKTHQIRIIDSIVKWFIPTVFCIAFAAGLYWFFLTNAETAILNFISVLLISCPCAIGIAVPLSEAKLINGLASLGALVRNRHALHWLGKETVFVFDKTGTVTEGRFQVLDGFQPLTQEQHAILKSMTMHSTHLISTAINNAIAQPPTHLQHVEELVGKGLQTMHEGKCYQLGSAEWLGFPPPSTNAITTTVFFTCNGELITTLTLGDRIRKDIPELLQALHGKRILLSGDSQQSLQPIISQCPFDEWHAQQTPQNKQAFIAKLREEGHIVCMIGDGINDAAALTTAHIGVSMVNATDISIQASDILLTTDRLTSLLKMQSLARKSHQISKQNLFWTFFYNVIGIALATTGYLSPIFSAFAMTTSSLILLFNSKRVSYARDLMFA